MTGYRFHALDAGSAFRVHISPAEVGQVHVKEYGQDVWYPHGPTLNLYVRGLFEVSAPGVSQLMRAGDSSEDWKVHLPAGTRVEEQQWLTQWHQRRN